MQDKAKHFSRNELFKLDSFYTFKTQQPILLHFTAHLNGALLTKLRSFRRIFKRNVVQIKVREIL